MRSAHCLPERSEGKTKVMRKLCLPFTVLKLRSCNHYAVNIQHCVATAATVYGIETP